MKKLLYINIVISFLFCHAMDQVNNENSLKETGLSKTLQELIIDYTGYDKWENQIQLIGHHGTVTSITISADGSLLASGSTDKTVKLWDLNSLNIILNLYLPSKINALSISRDKKYLAILFSDCFISIYDLQNDKYLHQNINFASHVAELDIFAKYAILKEFQPNIKPDITEIMEALSQVKANKEIQERFTQLKMEKKFGINTARVFSISPDNKYLLYANDMFAMRFNIETGICEETLADGLLSLQKEMIDFRPNDAQYKYNQNIWDYRFGTTCPLLSKYCFNSTYNNQISALYVEDVCSKDIFIFPITKKERDEGCAELMELLSYKDLPDFNKKIEEKSNENKDVIKKDIERAIKLSGHTNTITALVFSPDGKYLASGSKDKKIIIWRNINRSLLDS